jgi:hypothetical protein
VKTRVVHFKKEPYDVYIGRPSKWGNPFVVGEDGTRDEVIAKYRAHLYEHPELLHAIGPELQGRVLGCWCHPERCHGDVLAEIADGVRASEGGAVEEQAPKPKFAPTEQAILPGYKKHVPSPPIDYRQWNDGRGNKLDSPAYRGRTSAAGKLIPPFVGSDGQPIRLGTLQLVRDARGAYVIVDWSKPFFAGDEKKMETDGNEDDSPRETPLMGKQVWRTNDLADAKRAMAALHQFAEDLRKGLAADPAPCFDLAGKRVQIGDLSLRRFARGKLQGRYAVVNERLSIASKKRVTLLKAATFKEAVFGFERERKRREASPKPRRFVGALIAFSAPSGGIGSSFVPFDQREYPEPDSLSWKTAVDLYAQTGRWPKSAEYPTGRPAALEAEAEEARAAYLAEEAARPPEPERVDDPAALAAMAKLPEADRALLNQVLEQFDGVLVSIELPREAR